MQDIAGFVVNGYYCYWDFGGGGFDGSVLYAVIVLDKLLSYSL